MLTTSRYRPPAIQISPDATLDYLALESTYHNIALNHYPTLEVKWIHETQETFLEAMYGLSVSACVYSIWDFEECNLVMWVPRVRNDKTLITFIHEVGHVVLDHQPKLREEFNSTIPQPGDSNYKHYWIVKVENELEVFQYLKDELGTELVRDISLKNFRTYTDYIAEDQCKDLAESYYAKAVDIFS